MKRTRPKSSVYALLGSVVVHGLVAYWLATRPVPPRPFAQAPQTFEFTLAQPASQAEEARSEAEEPALEPAAPGPDEPRPSPRKLRANAPEPVSESAVLIAPTAPSDDAAPAARAEAVSVDAHAAPPTVARPKLIDLSPRAAALTLRDSFAVRSSCEAALSGDADNCAAERAARTPSQPAAGPRETGKLAKDLQLKPQRDGSFAFSGPSFHATIAADGRVAFDDKIRDLNSLVERHLVGAQVNTSAKRDFMESTRALRDQLADAAEALNQRRAKVALQHKLAAVLADVALSLAQKRAVIFGLWDDCASDESGSAAQAAIEAFVRRELPNDSPLAYGVAELAQLNRRRVSRRAFDPYASFDSSDAGARPG